MGFGWTRELPRSDFDGTVRLCDTWGNAEAQEVVAISPDMFAEFVFPYQARLLDRFGLNCYGCCEPLHARWQYVRQHRNLRRVSCSPWADYERMAEYLEDEYVFSMKPNPAVLAVPEIDEASIRKSLREAFAVTRGCVVEVIMKDNHTLGGRPENAARWCRIAKEEAEA